MNKHKKFIKDAYNGKFGSMCDDWKETIEEHYPEFKNKLEVGKWYKYKKWNDIMFMTEPDNLKVKGYGFDNGCWFDNRSTNMYYGFTNKSENWTLATKDEVEKALFKEVCKRYKVGMTVKCAFDDSIRKITSLDDLCFKLKDFSGDCNVTDDNGGIFFFENGKWAEIITKKRMTLKEIENKLGHEIELVLD